ncbi:MAG: hypothetical protein M3022_17790 [Actinomycetota bacterium]|nr:hypothetical protein [Actinomycetota bacterium]
MITRSLGRAATHVPGLRQLPVFKLISIAEVGLLARDHLLRLSPAERRRLIGLVRIARGRPSHLSAADREELAELVAKLEPRLLAGEAVDRISPVSLPKRFTRGRR